MPVELLAFPHEHNFLEKLGSKKPKRVDVEVVRQRNNICHGNVFEYINRDLGERNAFFTPVSVRGLAENLLQVSHAWADGLSEFRRARNLVNH